MRAVLRTFADISGLNVVIDPSVRGTVDVTMRDVPWDQALDAILRANKLGYVLDGPVVRVAPLAVLAEEEKQRRRKLAEEQALSGELRIVTRTLNYARAEDVGRRDHQERADVRGTVQVDTRTNTLVISDLQPASDPGALIVLRRSMRHSRRSRSRRESSRRPATSRAAIGVQWGSRRASRRSWEIPRRSRSRTPARSTGRTWAANRGRPRGDYPPPSTWPRHRPRRPRPRARVGERRFQPRCRAGGARARSGRGRLSTPRVATQNNVEAEITQGVQIPIQTVANNTVTVTFKDAALSLRVTPQITGAGTVILKIMRSRTRPPTSAGRSATDRFPRSTRSAR